MELTEVKQRARATWSAGDYDAIVDYIWSVGGDLVERVGVKPGDEVLDVACGNGDAAIFGGASRREGRRPRPDARAVRGRAQTSGRSRRRDRLGRGRRGGDAVRRRARRRRAVHVRLHVRPDHEQAAAEIVRVLQPGDRFGIAAWDPTGPSASSSPRWRRSPPSHRRVSQPPPLWGTRDHVSPLFEGKGVELRFEEAAVDFRFDSIDAAVGEYWEKAGPVVMLRAALEPEARGHERKAALHKSFEESTAPTAPAWSTQALT
jgi:SAM-dependent methyltransferase